MKQPLLLLLLLVHLGFALVHVEGIALAAPNPFTSPAQTQPTQEINHALTSPLAPILRRIVGWQTTIRQSMSHAAHSIHDHPLAGTFWIFMALAFAYGAAHALGPGHGKILAISYFLHRDASMRQALFYGYLSMLMHVLSATVLVLVGRLLLQMSASRAVDDMSRVLQNISYGLLLLMGLGMLVTVVRSCRKRTGNPVGGTGEIQPTANRHPWKNLSALALVTGMVPCPGAALVLIFSISLNIMATGLAAMVAISLGMGLCLTAVSLMAMKCRNCMLGLLQRRSKLLRVGQCLLSLAGALVISCTGGLLLLGSLLSSIGN